MSILVKRKFEALGGMPVGRWASQVRMRVGLVHRGPLTLPELAAACAIGREQWGTFSDVVNELLAEGRMLVRTRMESGVIVPYLVPAAVRIQEVRCEI